MNIEQSDFTYSASDRTRWQGLTITQKKQVLATAWPELVDATDARRQEMVSGIQASLCPHKLERIKRAMDSLGF